MDEESQIHELLQAARTLLPAHVVNTCESLNQHGEWELALSACQFHLRELGGGVPKNVAVMIAACEARFRSAADA